MKPSHSEQPLQNPLLTADPGDGCVPAPPTVRAAGGGTPGRTGTWTGCLGGEPNHMTLAVLHLFCM